MGPVEIGVLVLVALVVVGVLWLLVAGIRLAAGALRDRRREREVREEPRRPVGFTKDDAL